MTALNAIRLPASLALPTVLVALFATPALADGNPATDNVPRMLPYNGVLELDGRPVEASGENALHLLFSLYDGAGAEQPVYSQRLLVEVFGGRFTATIGPEGVGPRGAAVAIDTVIAAADDLYLGMTLLGDPDDPADDVVLTNRQRIYATPYAMWSTTATNLSVAGQAQIAGNLGVGGRATVTGNLDVGGRLLVDGRLQVGGTVALPAGSLDINDLTPAIIGESLARNGAALNVNQAWLNDQIRTWVRSHCQVQVGWRDGCNNCGSAPAKVAAGGADGLCRGAPGSACRQNVWSGFNTDGDVNGDDVFYVRMICD